MTTTIDHGPARLREWQGPKVRAAIARMLEETPLRVDLERVHFPGRRPVQLSLSAVLPTGSRAVVLAEYCPDDPHGHAERTRSSLRKSRNGQKTGLQPDSICVADGTGLVLRRPGLDERLPGLRLLHDPDFARNAMQKRLGDDPGPVLVSLEAHRLGKRAVLRMAGEDRVVYARLRAIKSGEGESRLARHQSLWHGLSAHAGLNIPKPLGTAPEIGVSFFARLAGVSPRFGNRDSAAVARALGALQGLDLDGLPVHSGADEAKILGDWLEICRLWRPDIARLAAPGLAQTMAALGRVETQPRPCHRDLHEKQILIENDVAGFLDFDTLCLSDPALDPGNLLAHLFLAGIDEAPLRAALDGPGIGLWRRAALFRLALIYAVTSTPDAALHRLLEEAAKDAVD